MSRLISAVVVSYHPNIKRLAQLLKTLSQQVESIILVDNGSDLSECDKSYLFQGINGHLIALNDNYGLGVAINFGLKEARLMSASFVLLMDQDSVPKQGMVDSLLDCYESLSAKELVGAIGPRFVDAKNAHISSHVNFQYWHVGRTPCRDTVNPVLADFVITSGSLIPLSVIDDVGVMDESLFIDHVDTEWILRAKSKGYKIFGDCNALLEHELGEYRKRIWLFRWRDVPVHKPFRYYYIFRNSVLLYKRDQIPLAWKRVDIIRLVQIFGFTLIFGPNRVHKIHMMFSGLRDGIRGETGRFSGH